MNEAHVRAIAVFFYYALPHELLALEATDKAVAKLKKAVKREPNEDIWVLLIRISNAIAFSYLAKYRKKRERLEQHSFSDKYEKIKEPLIKQSQLSFGPWRQFVREQEPESLFSLIWVHVLELKTEHVALASSVTHGTLVYRLSQLVGDLGVALIPGNKAKSPEGAPNA